LSSDPESSVADLGTGCNAWTFILFAQDAFEYLIPFHFYMVLWIVFPISVKNALKF
jgi:hypothetical protein